MFSLIVPENGRANIPEGGGGGLRLGLGVDSDRLDSTRISYVYPRDLCNAHVSRFSHKFTTAQKIKS